MNLYIVRHGDALPVGKTIPGDAERPLSSRGEKDIAALGDVIAGEQSAGILVLASPLTRARQTAEIIAGKLDGPPGIRVSENLAPGFRPKALLSELANAGVEMIVAVGHQPDLTTFLSYVIADQSYAGVAFPPGGVAKITMHPSRADNDAMLHWLLTPELVHRILSTR
jgi:phosphohistidine phosphatase